MRVVALAFVVESVLKDEGCREFPREDGLVSETASHCSNVHSHGRLSNMLREAIVASLDAGEDREGGEEGEDVNL